MNEYKNPGKILNRNLILDKPITGEIIKLKPDLVEHHDYEAVSSEMWSYLSSWYSFDFAIPRYLVYDYKNEETYLELYPQ